MPESVEQFTVGARTRIRPLQALSLLFVLGLAPVALLGFYAFRLSAQSTRNLVESNNVAGAMLSRNLIEIEFQHRLDTLEAFVLNPGFVDAVGSRNEEETRERLQILVETQPGVERAFVTDPQGLLWSDFPRAPESLGRNFSDRDWYRGLSASWQPYISSVYRRNAEPQVLLVAVAAPVRSPAGEVIGAAVYQIELDRLTHLLNNMRVGVAGHALLVDHKGLLAAHPTLDLKLTEYGEYAGTDPVLSSSLDRPSTLRYPDPFSGEQMLATSVACRVGTNHWTVLIQQPVAAAVAPVRTLAWQIAGVGLLVALGLAAILAVVGSYHLRLVDSNERLDALNRELSDENRERRRRYGTLLASLPGMAYRCRNDVNRTMEFVSDGSEPLTGYDPDSLLGADATRFGDLIHPDDRDRVRLAIEEAARRGEAFTVTYRLTTRSGEERWVWERGRAVVQDDGDTAWVEGFMSDITEQKSLEQQLLQSQKMEAIGQLAGGVAHDFNNLLTVITGYSGMMLTDLPADHPLRAELQEINAAGERAAGLTRQLLAFSRKQLLKPRILDLNDLVRNMDSLLRRLIGENIDLVTKLEPDLHPVRFDPGQVEQIVMNLAVNARDAMPDGGKLTIETENVELDESYLKSHAGAHAGPHVMIAITDTGTGMDAATRARIFEPFFTTKRPGKGTGLGLSTVFGIVKQSGGNIWVYSEPGRGTTFKVYLPRAEGFAAPAPRDASRPASRGAGELVLVVEDEVGVRGMIRTALERGGYSVLETGDPAEALELLHVQNGKIRLLLTDLVLPGDDGVVLSRKAMKFNPDLKIMLMSGYTDDAMAHHGLLELETAFIEKPIAPETLLRRIRELIDG